MMVSQTSPLSLFSLATLGSLDLAAAVAPTVMMIVGVGVLVVALITALRDARTATVQRPREVEPAASVEEAA